MGFTPNEETVERINQLQLPKLEKEIWLSTDSNPIRENKLIYMRFHMESRIILKYTMY